MELFIPMKNLELSIEREIDFMTLYELTPDELYFMKLLFYVQEGHNEFYNRFFQGTHLTKSVREVLQSLQEKGIINSSYEIPAVGESLNPRDVYFNKRVISSFLKHSDALGYELEEVYPDFLYINGRQFFLKNPGKYYHCAEDMYFAYGKAIKFNPQLHEEILELVQWGKENNLINTGICDFIAGHHWDSLRKLKEEGTTVFDTMTAL